MAQKGSLQYNLWKRIKRKAKQEAARELLREGEVGECSNCHEVYPWAQLEDMSTQEYEYVVCIRCKTDPRRRAQQGG